MIVKKYARKDRSFRQLMDYALKAKERAYESIVYNLPCTSDQEELLRAIQKIDEDEDFREMIIANAKKKAQEFSIEKTVDNLYRVIKSLSN